MPFTSYWFKTFVKHHTNTVEYSVEEGHSPCSVTVNLIIKNIYFFADLMREHELQWLCATKQETVEN
jgi:hypothetical protein